MLSLFTQLLFVFLFQDATPAAVMEGMSSAAPQEDVSLWDLFMAGGVTMFPIVGMSFIAVYITIERYRVIAKARKAPVEMLAKVKEAIAQGDINRAQLICEEYDTPSAVMLYKGLSHLGTTVSNIEKAVENAGRIEVYQLEKNLSILGTISGGAPMIGFLGTVTGMIGAFIAIAQQEGGVSPKLLSSGIYEAMVTTCAGLIVGIFAYIAYNMLVRQIAEAVHYMEITSIEFIDTLNRPS
jgi:biopolymer transport protein ExbB